MARYWNSLRFRLILLVVLGIVPPVGLIAYSGLEQRQLASIYAQESVLALAKEVSRDHGMALDMTARMLWRLAEDPAIKGLGLSASANRIDLVFENLPFPFYANIGLVDSQGNVLCSAVKHSGPVNVADRPYFQQALSSRDFSHGTYQVGLITGKRTINFGYPVLDDRGEVKAVLFAALDLAWFTRIAAEMDLPTGVSLTLIDANGTVLYRKPDPEKWVGHPAAEVEVVKTILKNSEGATQAQGMDGITKFYGFQPLGKSPQAGYVYAGIPRQGVVSIANEALIRNLAWVGVAAAAGLLAVWFVAYLFIVRRFNALVGASQEIAAGHLDARTGLDASLGEMGEVGSAFDRMAETVQHREAEMTKAHKELQREKSLLDMTLDGLPGIFYLFDVDGKFLRWNKNFEKMGGYSGSEITLMHPLDFIAPEDRTGTQEAIQETFEKGIGGLEARWLSRDGTMSWNLFTGKRIELNGNLCLVGMGIDITERKQREGELRTERRRFETLSENAPFGMAMISADGRFEYVNREFREIFGYSLDDIPIGRNWFRRAFPEAAYRRQVIAAWIEDLGSSGPGKQRPRIFTVTCKDGIQKVIHFRPVQFETGQHLMTCEDITERKKAEEHIKLNEARLQSLYRISQYKADTTQELLDFALGEAIKLTGSKVGYIYYYDEEKQVFELNTWSRDVMKECEVAEPRTSYELAKIGIWGEAVRQRRAIVVNDFHAPNPLKKGYPQGHVQLRNFMTVPVFVGERIVAVVGTANKESDYDESDLRQLNLLMDSVWRIAEARRYELDQRLLATALECAAEGVVITDTNGSIHYVNPALERMTGYSRDELLGRNPRILKSGEQDRAFYEKLWRTIKAGDIWTGRFINKRKDGTLYTEDETISPVRDASGTITNFVGMKRDMTEHLSLSTQLFHAQKMEAIGTLAGGIAHDFNNLLQAILGYTDLLLMKRGERDPDRKKFEVIHRAARDGAELVSRILTFSRKSESKTRPIDLNDEIRRVEKLLRSTLPRMIDIELVLPDGIRIIDADPAQIEHIVLNLGVNAQHAMPDGGRLVIETSNVSLSDDYVRIHVGARPGEYVLLTVSDNGIGITAEVLDRIFEPFFTTKPSGEGTGLGLSMVHGIVTQHGGHIRCYSESGMGTSFKIYFPVSASELVTDLTLTREMPAFGTETILLADDDDSVREMAREMMEMVGYRVLTARNGEEALMMYAASKDEIDLVILDFIMPGMGGKRCLRELLRIDPSVRVVVASGFTSDGLAYDQAVSGAKGFINKPYDAKDILGAIRKVLDRGYL